MLHDGSLLYLYQRKMMTKESLRIIFMGTPEFAVESLRLLVEGGYNVVGVVTMPDKPMGRHQDRLSESAVKKYAVAQGLRVLQPVKLKDEAFVDELRSLQADLQIVVAFRMLPEVVWNMPRLGTFNLHASLLPKYRGAAPINWAIINGEKETGITTFFLDQKIDTGSVIQQVKVPIEETDNAEDVHDKLMVLGSKLVVETVDNIIADKVKPIPQEELETKEVQPCAAPKIFKDTCKIDFDASAKAVYDFVRGLSPYPAAWTTFHNGEKEMMMKIYATAKHAQNHNEAIGEVKVEDERLMVAVRDGYVEVTELQVAGKKRMRTEDFLRGLHAEERMWMK